ncbi:MAG: HEAT repeat domain-containing protein [Pyrinomonadaceae bacterium]
MDVLNHFSILEDKGWFFNRHSPLERLHALTKIATHGDWRLIDRLIPFLNDRDREVQIGAADAISHLLKTVSAKNLYESLKYCSISTSDIDLLRNRFSADRYFDLLLIASFNHNGYVRQKAVVELGRSRNGKAIRPLIYRLGDWVPNVRSAALRAINEYKHPDYLDFFIANIADLDRLRRVERVDLGPIFDSFVNYLIVDNREHLRAGFRSYSEKTRQTLAKYVSRSSHITKVDLSLLLKDRNPFVRTLALDRFEKLSETDIRNLLEDKSSGVRLKTLRNLTSGPDFLTLVKPFLTDGSTAIRQFTRFHLRDEVSRFADLYADNLSKGRQVISSLLGLAEVDGKEFTLLVERYLDDPNIKIKRSALKALTELNPERAKEIAISYLGNDDHGLRRISTRLFERRPSPDVVLRCRAILRLGSSELKAEMLNLFSRIGGWTGIREIVLATVDDDEEIRELAVRLLRRWVSKASTLFVRPTSEELQELRSTVGNVYDAHERNRYFQANPLEGFSFYLS